MFIALGLTFLGMGLGFLLRGQAWLALLTRCVTPAIMLLLFALGVSVGGNQALMEALPRLGGTALALSGAGIAGSLACVACIRRYFRQAPELASLRSEAMPSGLVQKADTAAANTQERAAAPQSGKQGP